MADSRQLSNSASRLIGSNLIEDLEREVTCCVCLEKFTDPKVLPCQHVFCSKCIKLMVANRFGNPAKDCPTCRKEFRLPPGGADNLPVAFQMNTMIDLLKKMSSRPELQTCSKHNDHLTVYCETCSKVICRDCTISEEHNKHIYSLMSECYPKHHQQILDRIGQVKQKVANTDTTVTRIATREREVQQQGESIKEQINQHAKKLINDVQRSQKLLLQEVDTIVQRNLQEIQPQKQLAEDLLIQLKMCLKKMERKLEDSTREAILSQKHAMMEEMNKVNQKVVLDVTVKNIELKFERNNLPKAGIGKMAKLDSISGFTSAKTTSTNLVTPIRRNETSKPKFSFLRGPQPSSVQRSHSRVDWGGTGRNNRDLQPPEILHQTPDCADNSRQRCTYAGCDEYAGDTISDYCDYHANYYDI